MEIKIPQNVLIGQQLYRSLHEVSILLKTEKGPLF